MKKEKAPKFPSEPWKPYCPSVPKTTRSFYNSIKIEQGWTLTQIIEKCKEENINFDFCKLNVTARLDYGDTAEVDEIEFIYEEEKENPYYDEQMKEYQNLIKQYKKDKVKYDQAYQKYKEDLKAYHDYNDRKQYERLKEKFEKSEA